MRRKSLRRAPERRALFHIRKIANGRKMREKRPRIPLSASCGTEGHLISEVKIIDLRRIEQNVVVGDLSTMCDPG